MTDDSFDHDAARSIRRQWFRYLDTIEPVRGELHGFCRALTRNIWDAEDLLQDTLLVGFGMAARGDFHGERSPVRNVRAYLFRTATNAWLDAQRRRRLAEAPVAERGSVDPDPVELEDAVAKALAVASPQEFAALVLKEGYDFTLEEIADFIGTTEGTVKSALSRARRKMREDGTENAPMAHNRALVEAFVSAINSQDVARVIDLMAENVQIRVCNVGGGRGRNGIWTDRSLRQVAARVAECDGEAVVVMLRANDDGTITDVLRLEGENQTVTRIIDHCYAPETLSYVAEAQGLKCNAVAYHQPWETIDSDMVPTTCLPWREDPR